MWLIIGIVLLLAWLAVMTFLFAYMDKPPDDGDPPDRFIDPPWGP